MSVVFLRDRVIKKPDDSVWESSGEKFDAWAKQSDRLRLKPQARLLMPPMQGKFHYALSLHRSPGHGKGKKQG